MSEKIIKNWISLAKYDLETDDPIIAQDADYAF